MNNAHNKLMNKNLKILVIHTRYSRTGGEDSVVDQELKLLRKLHNIDVINFENKNGWLAALKFFFSIWNISASKKLKKRISIFRPDIIHVHNWHFASGPIIFRVAKKMHLPVVHTIHNYRMLCPSAILLQDNILFTKSLRQQFPWTAVKKKVYRNSMSQTFWLAFIVWFHKKIDTWKNIDQFICLTPFALELFQKSTFGVSIDKFTIKPNFTEVIPNSTIDEREKYFLFVGRLSEEKGLDVLLKAFEQSDFTIRIAGDGPLRDKVEKAEKENKNIIYLGALMKEEVHKEMNKCQALILPSICYEGMPMTILEAFSCSTPIIASNLGAMSTMIEHKTNGLHFEAGNSEDLRKQLENWSNIDVLRLQENAYQTYVEKYAPNLQMTYFDSIYKEAIQNAK